MMGDLVLSRLRRLMGPGVRHMRGGGGERTGASAIFCSVGSFFWAGLPMFLLSGRDGKSCFAGISSSSSLEFL